MPRSEQGGAARPASTAAPRLLHDAVPGVHEKEGAHLPSLLKCSGPSSSFLVGFGDDCSSAQACLVLGCAWHGTSGLFQTGGFSRLERYLPRENPLCAAWLHTGTHAGWALEMMVQLTCTTTHMPCPVERCTTICYTPCHSWRMRILIHHSTTNGSDRGRSSMGAGRYAHQRPCQTRQSAVS